MTVAAEADPPAPRPWRAVIAVVGLGALDLFLLRDLPGSGLLSILVSLAGSALLLVGTLWSLIARAPAMARSRAIRCALFVALGVVTFITLGARAQPLKDFHAGLRPGMTLEDVLVRLDAMYERHPRLWMFVAVWGTSREWALAEVHEAARSVDTLPSYNWQPGKQSRADLAAASAGLARARQVWFTLRTPTGYVQFFVALDGAGRVREVSGLTGHQA
jgi:hypothetical protein